MAQATAPQWTRWQEIVAIWKDNRWLFVIAGWLLGILTFPFIQQVAGDGLELLSNLVPEAVGIVFTVLILDRLAENRAKEELKRRLMREASSFDNSTAVSAIDWLRAEGWLTISDKIRLLRSKNLEKANLEGAYLVRADLANTNLRKTILYRAKLGYANLQHVNLWKANLYQANLWGTNLQYADLGGANLRDTMLISANLLYAKNIESALFDKKTVLPDATALQDEVGEYLHDEHGERIYDNYWTTDTDMSRYTDPTHPDFWQPEWVKEHK